MYRQALNFNWIALITLTLCCTCTPRVVYYNYDTGTQETIYKKVITHQILNPELKRLLSEYNAIYKDAIDIEGLGLQISCKIYTDSIYYIIGYAFGINHIPGLIICEPVDGKDVSLIMADLFHHFSLPSEHSIEILKNSNPKEYLWHKENQKKTQWVNGKFESVVTSVISDFPEWHITFDRNYNLLNVYKLEW
jgi:hypothetical protein